jgi:hypothetical protein
MKAVRPATVLVLLLGGAAACTPEGSGTGGRSVLFELAVEPPTYMVEGGAFTTQSGWDVELDEAVIALGPVYLWENPSVSGLDRSAPDGGFDLVGWASDMVIPTAWAHPGDQWFAGGELRGEFLEQYALDLLDGRTLSLGPARGIAGEVRSLTVILDPPTASTGGDPLSLRGFHAYVAGFARRDGIEIAFEGGLEIPAEGTQRQVDGLPVQFDVDDGGTLVIGVHPRTWFDQAHFDTLDVRGPDGRWMITPESQVAASWFIGARSAQGYFARWTTTEFELAQ